MRPELERDVVTIARLSAVPRILHVVSATTGLRFAAVARVTEDAWVACAVRDGVGLGLAPGGELDVTTTLCQEVRDTGRVVVMDHADEDQAYCGHPTPKAYGFQSYISVPIHRRGSYWGTLCALDPRPAAVKNDKTIEMFKLFADLIGHQLEREEAYAAGQAELADAQQTGELREQFIAVLGHDLRSPLSSLAMGAEQLLRRAGRDAAEQRTLERMRRSSQRMQRLVDDVMDFARARLGGGFALTRVATDVDALVRRVAEEQGGAHPGRAIHVTSAGDARCRVDPERVAQVVANLVGNALEHAPEGAAVAVAVTGRADEVVLRVENAGAGIEPAALPHLFRPFFRARDGARGGLGLGLYICAEIARAHGGRIDVASDPGRTAFTVTLPRVD